MQILRRLSLACAAAMVFSAIPAHADDNEAQIRSRQALEEKMQEINSQSATSTPPSVVKKPVPAKPKPTPLPPAPVQKPVPQPVVEQPVVAKPAPAPAQPAPVARTAPAATSSFAPPPNTYTWYTDTQNSEKLQQALQEKMNETQPPPETTSKPSKHKKTKEPAPAPTTTEANATTGSSSAPAPSRPVTSTPGPGAMVEPPATLPPLQGPPSSLSSAKQQKLDQLLQQYRADEITPAQYHEQRAKILSEP